MMTYAPENLSDEQEKQWAVQMMDSARSSAECFEFFEFMAGHQFRNLLRTEQPLVPDESTKLRLQKLIDQIPQNIPSVEYW